MIMPAARMALARMDLGRIALARIALACLALAQPGAWVPAQAQDAEAKPAAPLATYRLSGAKLLWPRRIGDDGVHTYIEWGADQPLPAVFAMTAHGSEEIVDGYTRGTVYTLDQVYAHLRFRIDKEKAEATRNTAKEDAR